jgi:hypothetical protein
MTGTKLTGTGVSFKDGTSLNSATPNYSTITNKKTKLSQFVNDLPANAFLKASGIDTSTISTGAFPHLRLNVDGNNTLSLVTDNCNCNCNCNC